jgi:hypothetical protein
MTNQQGQGAHPTVVTALKASFGRRPGKVLLTLLIAVAVFTVLWLMFWPRFEGSYLGDAGRTSLDITRGAGAIRVAISDGASDGPHLSYIPAAEDGYTLRFGAGLDRQAVIYHPSAGRYELVTGCRSIGVIKQNWGTRFAHSYPRATGLIVTVFMIAAMFFVLEGKAKSEPEAIYPMWLAYFGALFISAGVLVAAGEAQIFGFDGEPQNALARAILSGVQFFLDFGKECWLLLGLLALVSFTQWSAYVFSGLSGAARRSRFILSTWKWVALLIAKAFIGASAVTLSVVLVGSNFGWVNAEPGNVSADIIIAMSALLCGLTVFSVVPYGGRNGRPVSRQVRHAHVWMRRRLRNGPNDVTTRLQKSAQFRLPWH